MLSDSEVTTTIPVANLEESKKFYGQTLGLNEVSGKGGDPTYGNEKGKIALYESEFAGTNKGTSASWEVADIQSVVEALGQRGVKFEHYDMPDVTVEGDIHLAGDDKIAWFKDPSGNILCISQSA